MVILCHTQKEGSFFDMFLIRSESCKIKRQAMEMLKKRPRKFRKKNTVNRTIKKSQPEEKAAKQIHDKFHLSSVKRKRSIGYS